MLRRLLLTSGLVLIGCRGGGKAPVEQRSERASTSKAEVNVLCAAAAARGEGLRLMAASYGDVMAVTSDATNTQHGLARDTARALGATAAYDIAIGRAGVRVGSRLVLRTMIGLPQQGRVAVQPFVSVGRFAEPGKSEIVMSTTDAKTLGLELGDAVEISWIEDLGAASPTRMMSLVGLIELADPLWTGIDAASLWTTTQDISPVATISVGILLPASEDAEAWAQRYRSALGSEYSVLTADALQAPLIQWRSEVAGFCEDAKPMGRDATPFRLAAWRCDALAQWEAQEEAGRTLWGDEILWRTTPDGEGSWTTDVEGVRLEPVAAYGGAIFDERRAFAFSVHGFGDVGLERLAAYVTQGDLSRVTAADGLVLTSELAKALGVGPGDTVQVALAPGGESGAVSNKLQTDTLEIAAVVEFSRRLMEGVAMHGWMHVDRKVGTFSVQPNAALAWGSAADVSTAAQGLSPPTSLGLIVGETREADRRLHATLSGLCNAQP